MLQGQVWKKTLKRSLSGPQDLGTCQPKRSECAETTAVVSFWESLALNGAVSILKRSRMTTSPLPARFASGPASAKALWLRE
ncbi:hypothetical protein MTO96_007243 [Rhipicephalus appendiculatus]